MSSEEKNISVLKKCIKSCYEILDEKKVVDNKQFWKTVKPLISDKSVDIEI